MATHGKSRKKKMTFSNLLSGSLAIALSLLPSISHAVPSFSRQTGFQCNVCHTEFPQLTSTGRMFKLNGYTMSNGQGDLLPFAAMLTPSVTHTDKGQPGGAAPHFGDNNDFVVTQSSIFYAGRILGPYDKNNDDFFNHVGTFIQGTYDGVEKHWGLDNAEVRYANTGTFAAKSAVYGIYLNNNPTLQDPWNTVPAWTFPFTSSGLAPTPSASPLIAGGVEQQVGSLGGYVMLDNTWYLELGGYSTLSKSLQHRFGVDPEGETQIAGLAPYWRIAYQHQDGANDLEIGTYGLDARTYPGRDKSAGKDNFTDVGIDTQYQHLAGLHDITLQANWIIEKQKLDASRALGGATHKSNDLRSFTATGQYLFDKTYGLSGQYFNTRGDSDPLFYPDSVTGSPNSNGYVFQASWLPLNKGGGPAFWPFSNVKLSLQYVLYGRFNGLVNNIDGTGRDASDNNTTYLEAWLVF